MVVLPSNHRLAALKAISPKDLVGETFVAESNTAPVLRVVIDKYLKRCGIDLTPAHEADHIAVGMSLTRGCAARLCTRLSSFVSYESPSQRRSSNSRS
jgi:LysR family transcriptional regulator, hca operon transcriptional activator